MRKILAAVLSAALLLSTPLSVYADDTPDVEGAGTDVSVDTQDNTESEENSVDFVSGYIPSDLDNNTPVYENEIALYYSVPSSYNTIAEVKSKYPDNRNQNPYGTCWAFSSIGLAEFDLINDGSADRNIDLSELQLVYFLFNSVKDPLGGTEGDYAKYYNENASQNYLNYGGNYEMASRRLAQWVGAVKESDVPYSSASAVLTNGVSDAYAYNADVAHLQNVYMINIKQNPTDVKQQIMEHGAVGVMYYHDDYNISTGLNGNDYNYYDTSIGSNAGGHAVMVVGWDDNYSKDNFMWNKPSNNGAWLVRNSWGSYIDYFWMSYETATLMDTAWVFDFSMDDGFDNNYQLDGGLDVYPSAQFTTMANVFTAKTDDKVKSETLKAVSVSFSKYASVSYTIEVYTDLKDVKNPLSGTRQDSATTKGTTAYAGIYTIELADEVEIQPGSSFAVVVSVDKYALDYEQATSIAIGDKTIWDCAVSQNNGKTFYKSGDGFYVYPFGNLCVKAFTSDNVKGNEPETPVKPVEKTYTITYMLDGGTNSASNPSTYKTGNAAITLNAPSKSGYTFDGWYNDSTYTNRITEIPANSTSNYTVYAKWNIIVPDIDGLAISNKDAIADGVYIIRSMVDPRYVLDVSNGSGADGANIQLYNNNNTAAQQWRVTHDSNGYITLFNIGSGKALDVYGAQNLNGTNIQQYTSDESRAQKWIAVKASDGSYRFISALDINKCIDLSNAQAYNGANIQLYDSNNTKAQKWHLLKCATADDMAETHRNDVTDGIYVIGSATDNGFVLDVSDGSRDNGANIQIYADNGTAAQQWRVTHDSKGYVILTNVGSGKALDATGASTSNGTNIQQYESNDGKTQKWIAIKNSDGTIKFISALDVNKCVDLSNGIPYNGANIQLYDANGTKAQSWNLTRCASIEDIAGMHRNDVSDGTYIIRSVVDNNYAIDVSNASPDNGANVQLYSSNGTGAQKWRITHDVAGFVTIINVASGKALDVDNANTSNGSNIQQYSSNGTKAQKWIIIKDKNGSIEIVSALDANKCLDLSNATASNGANIQLYESNGTKAQRWKFDSQ